ncbi:hypothetical protein, partial [Halorubrum tibetense]|uniref:hypothetical protein n=1 Tax=Halorubrum tibetense TaxID=175631 RepID=UPI0036D3F183
MRRTLLVAANYARNGKVMKSIEDIEECGYDFDTLCQVIDNQKSNDETPAVGPAFDRLVKSGLGKKKVYRYIAGVLSTEIILG